MRSRGQLRGLSSSERPPRNTQTGSRFVCLGEETTPDLRNDQIPATTTLAASKPRHDSRRSPFTPDASCEHGPRAREACQGSQNRRSAYLEKCRRVWIGDDQRGNENHAREVARPLRGREDADRTALREEGARAGRGAGVGPPGPELLPWNRRPQARVSRPTTTLLHVSPGLSKRKRFRGCK